VSTSSEWRSNEDYTITIEKLDISLPIPSAELKLEYKNQSFEEEIISILVRNVPFPEGSVFDPKLSRLLESTNQFPETSIEFTVSKPNKIFNLK
jgi:hypothetical protein